MKKMLTFVFASMLVLMVTASANASQVILNSQTNYEINIDGRIYNNGIGSTTITDLNQGAHTINVYQVVSNGLFGIGKKRNLVSTQQFNLGTSDVYIDVSQNGQIRVNQNGGYGNNTNRNRNGGYNNDGNNTNAGPGNSDWGHQQGRKNGHNKNKKNKQHKHGNDNDENDDRNDRNDRNDNYRRGNN
jgi:hypothetical protein